MAKVFKYGANVDTDVIIPARYLNNASLENLAAHCMQDIDEDFASSVKAGDYIVAGDNFGSGSSREHAPLAIKAAGIRCVIAPSFARIFYRNAFNIGLPILECAEAAEKIAAGDELDVNLSSGLIRNLSRGESYQADEIPPFMQELIAEGGLVPFVKKALASTEEA